MRKRARRLYDGNLSAVVAEGLRRVREEEGRERLLEWLGDAARATPAELQAVREEWRNPVPRRRARRKV